LCQSAPTPVAAQRELRPPGKPLVPVSAHPGRGSAGASPSGKAACARQRPPRLRLSGSFALPESRWCQSAPTPVAAQRELRPPGKPLVPDSVHSGRGPAGASNSRAKQAPRFIINSFPMHTCANLPHMDDLCQSCKVSRKLLSILRCMGKVSVLLEGRVDSPPNNESEDKRKCSPGRPGRQVHL